MADAETGEKTEDPTGKRISAVSVPNTFPIMLPVPTNEPRPTLRLSIIASYGALISVRSTFL